MRLRKATRPNIDELNDKQLEKFVNRKFALKVKGTKSWITSRMFTSANKSDAHLFDSLGKAINEQIRFKKGERINTELYETY